MSISSRFLFGFLLLLVALLLPTQPAHARYLGGDPPPCPCQVCPQCNDSGACGCKASNTEGNLGHHHQGGMMAKSAFGATLDFRLVYNSKQADGSQSRTDTVMGYGWTHSFNILLFTQRGHMFRMDADGRITKYRLGGGGTFTGATGYFETLVRNPDGSFTLRQKDGTRYHFAQVPGTPFLIVGPVWRLQKITDRNNNTTSLTYAGGMLTGITDTYNRKITLTYAGDNLASVADPLGRVTRFFYDASGTQLLRITDPEGRSTQYRYNVLAQIVQKTDRDGRVFTYAYTNQKPTGIKDSAGARILSLSNPGNWATNETVLARELLREYVPATTTKTDGRGNPWRYEYDRNGYVTKLTAPDNAVTRYTYDPATLQIATRIDANVHMTSYQYDALGNMIRETNHLGHVTKYTYEPVFSRMTSMTDANNRLTTHQYDARGNRVKEIDPLLQTREWTYDSHGNVLTEKDKNGNVTTYVYDAFGNLIKMIDAVGNMTMMTYDAVGNLRSRTNPRGFTTSYQYDGLNRLVKETDALGKITQTLYDGEGNRVQLIDRELHATTYQYDLRQRLVNTIDALNQMTTQAYDGNDNRSSVTDKNLHKTSFQYDVQNRLTKITDALLPIHNVSTITYDPVGNKLTETDANGHTTTYQYDALNRMATKTDAEGNLTRVGYEGDVVCLAIGCPTKGSSKVTKQIDAEGKVTYFKYDGLDRLITQIRKQTDTADVIDSDDAVTRYSYDAHGNRLTTVEPNGNTMTYTYDALNRQVKVVNAAGDTTNMTYDPNSNVKTVTAPNLNVTTATYDALDRVIQVDDSVGRVATYTYDNVGNRLTQKDGNGNGTTNNYDAIYRITDVTDALGKITHYNYDPVGNLLKTTDREGKVTTYLYDEINRRIQMTDAQPFVTKYEYDGVGNLTAIKAFNDTEDLRDPPQITSYDYDKINRLITETYPDAVPNTRTFTYDRVSNLKTRTDQKAQTTSYSYSDLYFLTRRDYPVSADDNMSYDLSGRMLTAERGGWPVTFAYDGANRVTSTAQNGKTLAYSYNIPGRTRSVTYPGGRAIIEATDARRRLGKIDDAGSPPPIVQYNYDLGNRVVSRVYRNGTAANYGYNANDWITSLNHVKSDLTQIAGFTHAHDNEGNKRFENKSHDPVASEAFAYDNVYRLIDFKVGTLVGSTVPVPTTQTQYTLDGVGNWKVKTKDAVPETRTHNAVNEITSIGGTPVLSDPNGNTSEDTRYTYAYDEENRLTVVTRKSDGRLVGQYQYDALSRRIRKIADPATPSIPVETRYFYDGARIVEEQNPAGTAQATYVYGNYIDEILTMDRAGQTFYYHQNSLWSVEAITDAAGNVVERYAYDAYGLPAILNGVGAAVAPNPWGTPHSAIGNPWMFTGRQFDEETGIYFYRARYYDPVKGRFLQRDPLGYVDGMNLYSGYFVPNATDPSGESWRCCWLYARYMAAGLACIGTIVGAAPACITLCVTAGVWTGGVACWACIVAAPGIALGTCEWANDTLDDWIVECRGY